MNPEENDMTASAVTGDAHEPQAQFLAIDDDEAFDVAAVADNPDYQALYGAILARVKYYFEPAGVPADMIEPYARVMCEDIEAELNKFAKGQLEHGGDIRDRNMDEEMTPELMDLKIYHRIKRLQPTYIKLNV